MLFHIVVGGLRGMVLVFILPSLTVGKLVAVAYIDRAEFTAVVESVVDELEDRYAIHKTRDTFVGRHELLVCRAVRSEVAGTQKMSVTLFGP